MEKLERVIQFGEVVEGYEVPVLNEREIRASAGQLPAHYRFSVKW